LTSAKELNDTMETPTANVLSSLSRSDGNLNWMTRVPSPFPPGVVEHLPPDGRLHHQRSANQTFSLFLFFFFSFLLRSTFFSNNKKRIEHFHSQFYSGPLSFFSDLHIFLEMSGISLSRCVWYVMNDSRFVLHAVFRHRKSVGDCLRRLFSWRIYLTFELFE
jgi:hypothetical protein